MEGKHAMKLTLKNIGKIGTASVEINGITVIAGENNTGKSTVGRAFFAVFNSFCNVQRQIENERVDSVENLLDRMYINSNPRFMRIANTNEIAKTIVAHIDLYRQAELSDMQKKLRTYFFNMMKEKLNLLMKKPLLKQFHESKTS